MSLASPKIIIIGAGAAGIAAATRLLENGINDVTILEAENRIGGRVHSVDLEGSMVDLGGQWCHGQTGNIVYQLVKDLDLLSPAFNDYSDFTYYLSDGSATMDKATTDLVLNIANDVFNDENAARNFSGTFGDYFIYEYEKRLNETFPDNQNVQYTAKLLLDWFHKLFLGLDAPSSWFEVPAAGPFDYEECEGNKYLQWRDKGYHAILDVMMKKIPDITNQLPIDDKIFLNKEVNRIIWDSDSEDVRVECSDGTFYSGDHVIVTISLGALKILAKNFEPALPTLKETAIEAMAIGSMMKIILKFPSKWWPDDLKGFSLAWTEEDRKTVIEEFPYGPSENGRSWLEDIYGFYVIDSHPDVLLGWFVGPMVEEVEKLPDDIIINGCFYLINKFVGDKHAVSQPEKILRSMWKTNPHFGGAYTYPGLEAAEKNVSHDDLATPVTNSGNKPVILFAGEGTHSTFYSTVHGAIETGFREANRLLNIYRS